MATCWRCSSPRRSASSTAANNRALSIGLVRKLDCAFLHGTNAFRLDIPYTGQENKLRSTCGKTAEPAQA